MLFEALFAVLVASSLGVAKTIDSAPRASVDYTPYILGGVNAIQGLWKWQLSLERLGTTWSHSCGATLLSTTAGLTAAHCVDAVPTASLRIVAGLYNRTDYTGTQITDLASYTLHQDYNVGIGTFPNDIAIVHFATPVVMNSNVAAAVLPPNDNNRFNGSTCTITGWGRTSSSTTLPEILQQADIRVIDSTQCSDLLADISGVVILDTMICGYDPANLVAACNADSGGPMNCPVSGVYQVAGLSSWGIQGAGRCLPEYPSVYTRVSFYLDWIDMNTP